MTTVLITGITSFIGGHLAKKLIFAGINVFAAYRKPISFRKFSQEYDVLINKPNLKLIQIDSFDEKYLRKLPKSIDAIVHLAAIPNLINNSMEEMVNTNILGCYNLQNYALRSGATKFIYTSSLSIYGEINTGTVNKYTPINDPGPYGSTKYLGERVLAYAAESLPTLAIRLPGIIGFGAHRAWMPNLIDKLVSNKEVAVYSPNAKFNNAVHVDDLSEFILQLLLYKSWNGYSAFPIGAKSSMKIIEIINFLKQGLNSQSSISIVNELKKSFLIDSTYAEEVFGYIPVEIDVILQRYLNEVIYFKRR